MPTSRGGDDSWMNCITACRSCNGHKGNRLPEEARMSLHYLPYVPSLHEDMILRGRRILADQMEFLLASVPRSAACTARAALRHGAGAASQFFARAFPDGETARTRLWSTRRENTRWSCDRPARRPP